MSRALKSIIVVMMSCVLMVLLIGETGKAHAATEGNEVLSSENYDGFQLTWTNHGKRDILLSASNFEGTISFSYDENDYRISKTDASGKVVLFNYNEDGQLIAEQRDGHLISYEYNDKDELSVISIDGNRYECVLDDSSVSKLKDEDGKVIAVYQYTDGCVSGVYGVAENGALIDKSGDSTFVGNLNRVTFRSYYYDVETGWYYCGRYYDVAGERFVDGQVGLLEEYLEWLNSISMYSTEVTTVGELGDNLYELCIDDSSFGGTKYYTTYQPWYEEISSLEICARLIYGENPYATAPAADQCAVAWVIWNRMTNGSGYGGYTLRAITTAIVGGDPQFTPITGTIDETLHARTPDCNSNMWDRAVRYACYLYAAEYFIGKDDDSAFTSMERELIESEIYPELLAAMPKPTGITTQTDFRSYDAYFASSLTKTNIALAGYGSWETISNANLQTAYNTYRGSRRDINIFFNAQYS